jgi:hypothetical protein
MNTRRIVLEQIDVPEPCPADWDAMTGDGPVRFCQHCRKNVYNLSEMPRDAAERLVCESAGSLCVRFYRLQSGDVLTLNYGHRDKPRRDWRFWTLVGTLGAIMASAAHALLPGRPGRSAGGVPIGATCLMGVAPPMPTTVPTTNPTNMTGSSDDADETSDDPVTDPDASNSPDPAETP